MRSSIIFGLVTVLTVALVVLINEPLLLGQGAGLPSQTPTSAYRYSSNGLRLDLSIGASVVAAGQPLVVRVGEHNPTSGPLNVTAGRNWALQDLRIDSCYASIYPFGVALYKGTYTETNVTGGQPLEIFPVVPCPLLIRLVTGYYFNPDSNNAIVLPGTGPSIPMFVSVTIPGTYPKASVSSEIQPLTPGAYTVVAGDEWGTLLFLHFRVS